MPALEVRGLTKHFGATTALDALDLTLAPGEVRALLGENGSGKSTFIKILSGYHTPDCGTVMVNGRQLGPGSPESSTGLGLRFVHQNLGLVESLTVEENLCMMSGYALRFGTILERRTRADLRERFERLGLHLDPKRRVEELSPAERTGVAVTRALRDGSEHPAAVLVLDEPTANLPDAEVQRLLAIIRTVAAGGTAVIYVTHRLEEVPALANAVTILRDGHEVTSGGIAGFTRETMLHNMLGSEFERAEGRLGAAAPQTAGEPLLEVRDLTAAALDGVSLRLLPGEIVGIGGITGSGREQIASVIFGAAERSGGEVLIGGTPIKANRPHLAIEAGAALVPASRERSGGFMEHTARENLSIGRISAFWKWPTMRQAKERSNAAEWFERLQVRPANGQNAPLNTLSGGNQQKVVFAKWLQREPQLFLLEEPTQGVDVATKAFLHGQLNDAARRGAAVVVSSSDNEELASLCQRVLILVDGRIRAELRGAQLTSSQIAYHSLGAMKEAAAYGA